MYGCGAAVRVLLGEVCGVWRFVVFCGVLWPFVAFCGLLWPFVASRALGSSGKVKIFCEVIWS
jgi:hypothetical protein